MNTAKASLSAVSYSVLIGISFLITKMAVSYGSSDLLLAHRYLFSLLAYGLFVLIKKPELRLTKERIRSLLPLVLVFPLVYFTLQFIGLETATSSEGGIIFALVPVITVICVTFLGKFPSLVQVSTVIVSVVGVLITFGDSFSEIGSDSKGIAFLFLSALSFSIFTILANKATKTSTIHEITFTSTIAGFIGFMLFYFFNPSNRIDVYDSFITPLLDIRYVLIMIYLSVFGSVIATFLSNYSLKHMSAARFSVFTNLATLIAMLSGALVLGEILTLQHYLGSILILIGVISTNFSKEIEQKLKTLKKMKS